MSHSPPRSSGTAADPAAARSRPHAHPPRNRSDRGQSPDPATRARGSAAPDPPAPSHNPRRRSPRRCHKCPPQASRPAPTPGSRRAREPRPAEPTPESPATPSPRANRLQPGTHHIAGCRLCTPAKSLAPSRERETGRIESHSPVFTRDYVSADSGKPGESSFSRWLMPLRNRSQPLRDDLGIDELGGLIVVVGEREYAYLDRHRGFQRKVVLRKGSEDGLRTDNDHGRV